MGEIQLKGKTDTGILLLHGFTGYTDELEEMSRYLNKKGITVSVPILPGHGTDVYDLSKYSWQEWFDFVKEEYKKLDKKVKRAYIGGISMGAGLALHYAAHYKTRGVVALSAGVKVLKPSIYVIPYVKSIIKYFPRKKSDGDVSKKIKRTRPEYNKTSLNAVDELRKFFIHLKDDIPEITVPVLMVHGLKDHTIPFESASDIFEKLSSKYKKFVTLEKSYHLITMDVEKKKVFEETHKFIKKKRY